MGLITSWLSSGIAFVNQYGVFGWWVTGLLGALLTASIFLAVTTGYYTWVKAITRQRWARAVDDFNPLDSDFKKKRIDFNKLANPLTRKISKKQFFDCELIGPANIFIYNSCEFNRVDFFSCPIVVLRADERGLLNPGNSIVLENIQMHGGAIHDATLFIPANFIPAFKAMGGDFVTLTGDREIDSQLHRKF